tara:strand:- start:16617 stop:17285 length:669 start_codon:yes stop_codon:yes gene_type:complete
MDTKPIKFNQPWGFSKLDVFRACPAKFKYQFIEKLPQGGSPAMERGAEMHENIEMYLNGWGKDLLPSVVDWKPQLDALKLKDFKGEQAIGIDKDWNLLPDWFGPKTWLRVKMDAYFAEEDEMTVIDFKSGQFRIPSQDQIELYAVSGISIKPTIKKVNAQFWFLDSGDVHTVPYTSEQLLTLRKKYETAVAPLYAETIWKPEPSRECRWCPYSKTKGGKCQY